MHRQIAAISAIMAAAKVAAQEVCTLQTETHPSLTWSNCTSSGSCTSQTGSVVIDANWRWVHTVSGYTNCYTGNEWDTSICNSSTTCASDCCVDGSDYSGTYGVTTSGSSLNLKFVTQGTSKNIGSRLYLMASDTEYQTFNLLGNEFTFDVDVSNLPYSGNKAGAKYGTGYCDSQCPRDLKFINGLANVEGWTPSTNDANAGVGDMGSCCSEMDIWEANKMSAAFTPHPCTTIGQTLCEEDACGGTYSTDRYAGECDPDGCDFNSYRQGNTTFYGPGDTVNTNSVFTVVTQFIETSGSLSEIRRFYVQNGVVIPNSYSTISGTTEYNSITEAYCDAQKAAFGDETSFQDKGGLTQMGAALAKPMVLVMSLWDDHYADMLWLDSTYPTTSTSAGAVRGSCATTSGVPSDVEADDPNSSVIYKNIKFGPINSTFTQ
ncbi:Exoglucanase 1 [Cytospora mali]|uniref:Glucanase n=1 Tax=Cytospora mali TaxID=578113 RepID=A0A194USF1_CYTMA|nr:Exoglucanase 1 [Valsa mali var. pyri (nom. inval.)]